MIGENGLLPRDAKPSAFDLLRSARLNVVATDNIRNLPLRASTVIDKHALATLQLSHRGLSLEHLGVSRCSYDNEYENCDPSYGFQMRYLPV
jgi:hypothetical protein